VSPYLCVDASVAAKWVLPEEYSDQALALYRDCDQSNVVVAVPPHLPIEVINIIRRRVVRGLITHAEGQEILRTFTQFSVRLVIPPGLYEEAFNLADAFNLPAVYDAHYVALAKLLDCDLWTADERLLNTLGDKLPYVMWIAHYS